MARNLINRYVWLVDTISRYGRITLKDLNAAWLRSEISEGKPLARRTFFHYRDGVEEMFDINIKCDKATFEYYIDDKDGEDNARLRSWLVDSVSMSGTLSNARDISNRIMLENVPSAREHLPVVIDPSHACGIAKLVKPMAIAAAAAGADGLMIEVHNDPPRALCDGAQSLTPEQFDGTMKKVFAVREALKD